MPYIITDCMEIKFALLAIALALMMGLTLAISVSFSLEFFLIFAALSAVPAFLIVISVDYIYQLNAMSRHLDAFFDSLYNAYYMISCGTPASAAVGISANACKDDKIKHILATVSKKMVMGRKFTKCLGNEKKNDAFAKKIKQFIESTSSDSEKGLYFMLQEYGIIEQQKKSDMPSIVQHYSTASMFISTIIPSFVIFIFIANLIVSSSMQSMILLSSVLIIMIPILYVLLNVSMARRLFE
jgi:hypothetical protein